VIATFKELLTKGGSGYEATFRLLNKDGSYIYLEANGSNQLNNPAINAIVINSREITKRKKAEEEEEKTRLIAELSQNNKELKQFSYITSHNLRAPVTNLIALLGLIDQEPIDNDNLKTLLAGFKTSTIQLNQTLNDLINILIIKENIHHEKTHINFKDVFENVKSNLQQLIEQSNASISDNLDTLPRIPFILPYIESIFLNLLTNAIKYKQPNCTPIISVTATITHQTVTIHIADNGLGMDMAKVKDRIFGLYQRFHNHPDSKGIGLYLVQAQMQAMGGSISVESMLNVGTTFTLRFPLE
jgi:signal transduction histidine kinase